MLFKKALVFFWLVGLPLHAHEMTPAYPSLNLSHIENIYVTKVKISNYRSDTDFFSLAVFDADWEHIKFASRDRLAEVRLNKSKVIEIYIRSKDADRVVYICSESKLFKNNEQVSLVSSRICSKIKR